MRSKLRPWALSLVLGLLAAACGARPAPPPGTATAPAVTEAATATPPPTQAAGPEAEETGPGQAPLLYVLSNSSPHVSVIDPQTKQVVRTADLPDFTAWTWNDDNDHFDGRNLWLGLKDPETNEAEVITLDLDTLEVTHRFPVGTEKLTLYIGKASRDGLLHVGKMDSDQVVVFDTRAFELLDTWDVPVNGDVVCDADISTDPQGAQRFVYPTRKGDTLVSLDPASGEVLQIVDSPPGSNPLMLTAGPGGLVWVQEVASNTNAVYRPELGRRSALARLASGALGLLIGGGVGGGRDHHRGSPGVREWPTHDAPSKGGARGQPEQEVPETHH